MGTSLSGLTPATTFDGLLKVGDNDPLTADLKAISDGSGNDSAIQLSTGELKVMGQFNVDTDTNATTINLRGDGLDINQIYQANEVTYNSIQMINSSGIRLKNGTGTALLARGGNIGIGGITTTPTARLQVKGSGTTSTTTSLLVQNSLGDNVFSIKDNGLFTFNDAGGGDALTIENGSNISQIRYNDNLWLGSSHGTYVPTLKIDRLNGLSVETNSGSLLNLLYTNGNLGIGETTPTARLHVKGSGNDATTTALLVENSDGTTLFSVKDSGYVDINPTNSSDGSFKVRGDGADNLLFVNANDNYVGIGGTQSSSAVRAYIKGKGATSATTSLLVENSAGTDLFKVSDDGNVQVAEYIYPADGTTNSRLRVSNSSGTYMYYSTGNLKLNPNLVYTSTTYGTVFSVSNSTGDFSLNGATGAKMAIKGNGNDATTTALLVQNSDGIEHLKVTDDGNVNVRQSLYVNHLSVSSRALRLGWGSIYATDNSSELVLGAVYSQNSSPRIYLGGKTRASGADAIQVQTLNGMYIAPTASAENPSAQLQVKGSGATSATAALLVENSAGTEALKVRDDGKIFFNGLNLVIEGKQIYNANTTNGFLKLNSNRLEYSDSSTSGLDSSAALTVTSTTRGFLPPRMTDAERDAITSPAAGLMIYDTSNNQMNYWNGSTWIAF